MKIVTWNINGIRTFGRGIKTILDSLGADIICVQETKVTRDLLDERTAIVDGYNSYFSFSRGRSGYSGVATYCKDNATPFAAEEGLTGLLTNHEDSVGCYGDQAEFTSEELQLLDNEGRAVITQHRVTQEGKVQTVAVINVYCPRADPEKPERKQFKLQFYKLLQCRAEALLRGGSSVIVLGDVNTSHRPIDHCDPNDIDDFEENPGRKWLNGFLGNEEEPNKAGEVKPTDGAHHGNFVDTFRLFHPARTGAFTCWSTMTGARQTNYGTRIDYIFADRRLASEQFVAADIMPEVEGSDHCPVWGELGCSVLPCPKPPALATCRLPEFAGKQQKLSRFLVKVDRRAAQPEQSDDLPGSQEEGEKRENIDVFAAGRKRTLTADSVAPKGKKTKTIKASSKPQGNLLSFFKPANVVSPMRGCEKPCDASSKSSQVGEVFEKGGSGLPQPTAETKPEPVSSQPPAGKPKNGASFWKSVLHGPPPPPPCKAHGEPCVLRTVKKEGPNMGRQFFVCARPQGHASNPEARCNYFAWVERGK